MAFYKDSAVVQDFLSALQTFRDPVDMTAIRQHPYLFRHAERDVSNAFVELAYEGKIDWLPDHRITLPKPICGHGDAA